MEYTQDVSPDILPSPLFRYPSNHLTGEGQLATGATPTPLIHNVSKAPSPQLRMDRLKRPHTKSRQGCFNCKTRRVKCQETKPACLNCLRRDQECVYPAKEDGRWRLVKAGQKQHPIPRLSPAPSASPRIGTAPFTSDDLRFWHHFLADARPGLPLGDEGTWSSEIPAFAHDCPHLLHALLSLGASYCCLTTSQRYKYAPLAIAHRGKALKALGAILAKGDNCTMTEMDSALATCYALTFQARQMSDGVIDFAVMVRGCSIITNWWRAHHYNDEADVYVFRNIRYAAPPLGELRWSKPAPPEFIPGVQDGSYGHNCIPAPIPDNFLMPGSENLTKDAAEGSKDQAIGMGYYEGTSLIQRADHDLILVTINYRLGGFGFLAGEPVRAHGVFNAGLHDQRAALAWVQSYIHLLGGDPDNVSAWGQSAGAGSLIYHLIAESGNLDPLFKRVILQSPSFGTNADPQVNYKRFRDFAAAADCPTEGEDALRCLRLANSTVLKKANEEVYLGESSPVPDGAYIRNPAVFEYAIGNTWKNVDSVLVSHVLDEGSLFLPDPIPEGQLRSFISRNLPPNSTEQTMKITDLFESLYANSTKKEMLSALYTNLLSTCNLRAVLKAYPKRAWAFQYSFLDGRLNGKHGSDMPATWYNPKLQASIEPLFAQFQRYLTNHARTGNPNAPCDKDYGLKFWPEVVGLEDEMPGNIFNMTNWGFDITRDDQMSKIVCDTWMEALVAAIESKR
ncbi:uncharacterized protein Aud_003896 [Aspergillus udagawae]|uniref:Zn(2)-C6 fungal-type domain-containing protein n=1 Tax=Aspergillus udagawae TaxID=91492 RepID=A0A8E0QLJ4_9EURO|nr:uncharacterized protein Aud_003896 [Aspergillus udagawae]GIC87512.1 hypothetical protein Aud_003896 [Aspergillus udagawae]